MKRKNKKEPVVSFGRWQKIRDRIVMPLLAATGSALLVAYSDYVTSVVKELSISAWARGQDFLSSVPDDKILGVNLTFYPPQQNSNNRFAEGLSVTIWPAQCKEPGGKNIVRTFDDHLIDTPTQVIVGIACRSSGRVRVMLTPQSGESKAIYDDVPDDGEQLPYAGVPGSYSAGILTFYWLDVKEPDGPWVPVNKCQIDNSCNTSDFELSGK